MNRAQGLSLFLAVFCLVLGLLGGALADPGRPRTLRDDAALRGFASWQELTKGPHKVAPATWSLCMPPPPEKQLEHPGELVPFGADRFIRVYANPQAYPLMRKPQGPKYPAGSRIAKVKLLPGSDRPVSVAFMVKREAGYNPASLDWEFLFFDGDSLRQSKGDFTGCQSCHGDLKAGDGIFASYLPERQYPG